MSDASQGPGWWQATDGRWYPPETLAAAQAAAAPADPTPPESPGSVQGAATGDGPPAPGWWRASDGNWYPPASDPAATGATTAGAAPAPTPNLAAAPTPGPAPAATVTAGAAAPAASSSGGSKKGLLVVIGIFVVLVLIAAGAFVVTRKSDSSASGPTGPTAGVATGAGGADTGGGGVAVGSDDLPTKDVTLADDVVVVKGNGGKTLKSFDPTGATMTLDASAEGVDQLAVGKVLLLTGVTAIKVKGLEKTGDGVVITTEPATLPEVVKDGDQTWTNEVDPAKGNLILSEGSASSPDDGGGSGNGGSGSGGSGDGSGTDTSEDPTEGIDLPLSSPRDVPSFIPDGESAAGAAQGIAGKTIKGKVGPLDGEITYDPSGKGATLHVKLTSSAEVAGTIEIDVTLGKFDSRGHFIVKGSETQEFEHAMDDFSGKAEIVTDLKGLQNVATIKVPSFFKLPFSISFPAPVGGIPFTMSVGGTIQVDLSMALNEAALKGRAEVTFSGDAGFNFKGGTATLNGKRIQDAPDLLKSVQGIANGPVGVVVTTELPKVGFGFSFLQTGAEVYISNGLVASQTILPAPAQCTAMNVAYVLAGGVTANFLGKEIEIARKAFVKKEWNYQVPNDKRCNKAK